MTKPFYSHVHAFRGFAILNIVACHVWVTLLWIATSGDIPDQIKPLVALSDTLFHNATIYFAVISGLLFSLVLQKKSWSGFYRSKFLYVFLPYVVFSLFFTGLFLLKPSAEGPNLQQVLAYIPLSLLKGDASGHLWYIPILIALFALTPILKRILDSKFSLHFLALSLLLPLVISRNWPENSWHNLVFFMGPYALGMYVGSHYQQSLDLIEKYKPWLIAAVVFTAPVLFVVYRSEIDPFYGVKLQESVGYIQKMLITLLVLYWFKQIESRLPTWLYQCGDHAFAMYFIHNFFIFILAQIFVATNFVQISYLSLVSLGAIIFLGTVLLSVAFSAGIKKLSGSYSRILIGS